MRKCEIVPILPIASVSVELLYDVMGTTSVGIVAPNPREPGPPMPREAIDCESLGSRDQRMRMPPASCTFFDGGEPPDSMLNYALQASHIALNVP